MFQLKRCLSWILDVAGDPWRLLLFFSNKHFIMIERTTQGTSVLILEKMPLAGFQMLIPNIHLFIFSIIRQIAISIMLVRAKINPIPWSPQAEKKLNTIYQKILFITGNGAALSLRT